MPPTKRKQKTRPEQRVEATSNARPTPQKKRKSKRNEAGKAQEPFGSPTSEMVDQSRTSNNRPPKHNIETQRRQAGGDESTT